MKKLLILTVLSTVVSMSSGCMSNNCGGGGFHPFHWFHRGDACDTQHGGGGCGCGGGSGSMVSGVPTSTYGAPVMSSGTPTYIQPLPGPGGREILPNG